MLKVHNFCYFISSAIIVKVLNLFSEFTLYRRFNVSRHEPFVPTLFQGECPPPPGNTCYLNAVVSGTVQESLITRLSIDSDCENAVFITVTDHF